MSMMTPIVIERTSQGERAMDIYSRLLTERIVFLNGEVNDHSAAAIVSQFLHLESDSASKDIYFYVNSPGGSVSAGLAIYDVMQFIKPRVCTYVMGMAASMGSFLAQAGAPGCRYILPHARTMIHQPLGGTRGQATDIEIHAEEIIKTKRLLTELYVKHNSVGKTYDEFRTVMERDYYLSAVEAVQFGLADKVIDKRA